MTITEHLEDAERHGRPVTVVLRSGMHVSGTLRGLDLTGNAVQVGEWTVRIDEIVAFREGASIDLTVDEPATAEAWPF